MPSGFRIRLPGQPLLQERPKRPKFPRVVTPAKPRWVKFGTRLPRVGGSPADYYLEVAPPDTPTTSWLERLIYGWLVRNRIPFDYQVSVLGGRQAPGGAVVDFVIYLRHPPIVLRPMGRYWHELPASVYHDTMQKEALEEAGYIVVDIWEEEIEDMVIFELTMQEVVYGGKRFATR